MHNFIQLKVKDVMSTKVVTVHPQMPIKELELLFEKHGYNMFPVVENGKAVGIVSQFDYLSNFILNNQSPMPNYDHLLTDPVSTIFSEKIKSVTLDTPLSRVLEMMVQFRIKSFPVIEDDQVLGVVSRNDLIHTLRAEPN
ncbi:MAG: CBS domain-containing protein [bacterium]|jgi:CBS domain-containing protein